MATIKRNGSALVREVECICNESTEIRLQKTEDGDLQYVGECDGCGRSLTLFVQASLDAETK